MNDLIEQFKKHLIEQNRSSYTISAYLKDIEQLIKFFDSRSIKSIKEVTINDIVAYLKFLKISRYAPKSMFRKLNSIKAFFKFLENTGQVENNPSIGVEYPKYKEAEPRVLSETEYRALRDAARYDIRLGAMIELLLQSGIRIGELCRISVSDIKFGKAQKATLLIKAHTNNSPREIPLNVSAQNALRAYLQIRPKTEYDALFVTKTGRGLVVRNARALIDKMFDKAAIKNVKVNDLRNTFIAHNLAKGIDPQIIAHITGHKRVSSTEKYLGIIIEPHEKTKDSIQEL